jgi:hypothetical protein
LTGFGWTAPIPAPKNAHTVVVEALVPMLLWTSVPVVRRVDEELTIIDRFVVESALALAPMRAEDVEELTGVPREVVNRIAGRLTGLGLLRGTGGAYYAVEDPARMALGQHSVPKYRQASLTFLYLPYSDDLIAFPPGPRQADPPLLQRATPAESAPTPPELAGADRTEALRARILVREVAGLPDDIVDAADPGAAHRIADICPAYRCRGWVRGSGTDTTLVLGIRDNDGRETVQVSLRGAVRQAAKWSAIGEQASAAGLSWTASGGQVTAYRESPLDWVYRLDGAAADAAMADVALSAEARLEIHADECVLAVGARFAPLDAAASRRFALDHAIRAVAGTDARRLNHDVLTAAVDQARAGYELTADELTEAEVADRLWSDGHYWHVYALRSQRDFRYD